ncbi:MAG: hypothetical protein ACYDDB_08370 [bacterium]
MILFPINTEITEYVQNRKLVDTQISLKQSSHPFLKHDSFLDCHDVFGETNQLYSIKLEDIRKDAVNGDNTCIRGEINTETIKKIIKTLNDFGKTLRKRDKDLIIKNLSLLIF